MSEHSAISREKEFEIEKLLVTIGIPETDKGFQLLKDVILLAWEDENALSSIAKNIYMVIARRNMMSIKYIERVVHSAIRICSQTNDRAIILSRLLGCDVNPRDYTMSNLEFVSMAVIMLKLKYGDTLEEEQVR